MRYRYWGKRAAVVLPTALLGWSIVHAAGLHESVPTLAPVPVGSSTTTTHPVTTVIATSGPTFPVLDPSPSSTTSTNPKTTKKSKSAKNQKTNSTPPLVLPQVASILLIPPILTMIDPTGALSPTTKPPVTTVTTSPPTKPTPTTTTT